MLGAITYRSGSMCGQHLYLLISGLFIEEIKTTVIIYEVLY